MAESLLPRAWRRGIAGCVGARSGRRRFNGVAQRAQNLRLKALISLPRPDGVGELDRGGLPPNKNEWSAVYLAGSVLSGLIGVPWATAKLGAPRLALGRIRAECA